MESRRAEYYHKIYVYKKRREEFRRKYTGDVPVYRTYRYIYLTMKISQWAKEIRRLDVRKKKIDTILKSVNLYFNVRLQTRVNQFRKDRDRINLARQIFFKVGLESGICGTHLARHIGRVHCDVAASNRNKLIESFTSNPENKKQYHSFVKWFELNGQDIRA